LTHTHDAKRPLVVLPRAVLILVGLLNLALPIAADSERPPDRATGGGAGELPGGPRPVVGERLGFHGWWFSLPVGSGWIEVKEVVTIEGRAAYHIEAQGHTNDILSKFYPIHDVIHSYLDAETLKPLRFEKDQREGHYRAHEVVTFDHQQSLASYRSLLNNSEKVISLPQEFQDLISVLYWFRMQPLRPGQPLAMNIYTDEKIYQTEILVSAPAPLELLKRGTFPCVIAEPKASFKGLFVKRGRLWAYLTADEHRLPLLVKTTTPWGPMSAVLDADSLDAIKPRAAHADRHPARP